MGDVYYKGELVSRPWAVVLRDMEADGVSFSINEGRRTLARQTYFYNCMRCCCCNDCHLAALPSPFAPHIRVGRPDHAIDFDTLSHDIDAVLRWLANHGLSPTRPAGSGANWEPWHVEVSLTGLLAYYRKHRGDRYDKLPRHVERAARAFISARKTVRDRVRDRDAVDSKRRPDEWKRRDALVAKAVEARAARRERLAALRQRATAPYTRRVLRDLLDS